MARILDDITQAVGNTPLVRLNRLAKDLPGDVAVAASVGGVVSHASAAALIGLDQVGTPTLVDVTVVRGRKPPNDPRVRLHWTRHADAVNSSITSGTDVTGVTGAVRTVGRHDQRQLRPRIDPEPLAQPVERLLSRGQVA